MTTDTQIDGLAQQMELDVETRKLAKEIASTCPEADLRQFAENWIGTAAQESRNAAYWKTRAESAERTQITRRDLKVLETHYDHSDPKHGQTIAIDFDGVIHAYTSPFTKPEEIHDEPVDGALFFIEHLLANGFGVIIHTARASTEESTQAIRDWLVRHGLSAVTAKTIKITTQKLAAIVYIDDRGFRFEGRWPSIAEIKALRTWNKP